MVSSLSVRMIVAGPVEGPVPQRSPMRSPFLCALVVAATTSSLACDAVIAAQSKGQPAPAGADQAAMAAVNVQTNVDVQIKPEALDLETVNYLIKKGKVKDAEALEK